MELIHLSHILIIIYDLILHIIFFCGMPVLWVEEKLQLPGRELSTVPTTSAVQGSNLHLISITGSQLPDE